MRRPTVVALALAAAAAVLLALGVAHVRYHSSRSRLPEWGQVSEAVDGLEGRVEVRLDRRGIPHVRAEDDSDLWFVQGWLHARDRFFQMDLTRRMASGRLAELFGPTALPSDRRMRTLRLAAVAAYQVVEVSAEERRVLEAYAAGVNAALARYGRWIAPELFLLGVEPEVWTAADSLAVGMLLQLELSISMQEELRRWEVLGRFGPDRAAELWGWSADERARWLPPGMAEAAARRPRLQPLLPSGSGHSNNWALAPSRTATGRPLLANDPHMGVQLPGTWFAVHLHGPTLHVTGVSVPGAPGVLIGHTERVAWGLTMSMVDDVDLFLVNLDESRTRELIDGDWQPLRTVVERIAVRGATEPELFKVRLSERGPILREEGREVLAFDWSALHGPSATGAFLRMNRAGSVAQATAAWREVVGPGMNLVAADVEGHIAHQVVGRVPIRGRGAGRLPAPADDSRWAWSGFLPFAANPRTLDPVSGFVTTANHDLFAEGDYPWVARFPAEFLPPWRVRRIRAALAARQDWDVAGCLALQGDVVSLRARTLLQLLGPDLVRHGGSTARRLLAWDGSIDAADVAPTLAAHLIAELQTAVAGDDAVSAGLLGNPFGAEEILRLLAGGLDDSWWDDVGTRVRETREEVIAEALDALDRRGAAPQWGRVHSVRFRHPLADLPVVGPVLDRIMSRGPFGVGGDATTVNAHYPSSRRPYEVTIIPSMRFVADVGDWDRTVLVLPVGQSGRPWSGHYDDQVGDWLAARGHELAFSDAAVRAATVATIELTPGPAGED